MTSSARASPWPTGLLLVGAARDEPLGSGAGPPTSSTSTPAPSSASSSPPTASNSTGSGPPSRSTPTTSSSARSTTTTRAATRAPRMSTRPRRATPSSSSSPRTGPRATRSAPRSPSRARPRSSRPPRRPPHQPRARVYVFDLPAGTLRFKLVPTDNLSDKQFGFSVALDGTTAAIGAPRDREASASGVDVVGAAYLYDLTTGALIDKLLPPDGEPFDHFGTSVDIERQPGDRRQPAPQRGRVLRRCRVHLRREHGRPAQEDRRQRAVHRLRLIRRDRYGRLAPPRRGRRDRRRRVANDAGARVRLQPRRPGEPCQASSTSAPPRWPRPTPSAPRSRSTGASSRAVRRATTRSASTPARSTPGARPAPCNPADLADPLGTLDLADITAFVTGFTMHDPIADLHPDGLFDLADITAFVGAFTAGCP
jgi:hypothetical protein